MTLSPKAWIERTLERESLRPDLNRAIRGTAALMVPLLLGRAGRLPLEAAFAVLAAQNVAIVDVRGAYSLRFTLLLAMTAVLAASAALGGLGAEGILYAVAGMGVISLASGLWRHLSPDYGPSLVTASTLLYAIAITTQPTPEAAGRHLLATLAGGLWGLLLQVAVWPFRPQHPLRRAVSEAWIAMAQFFAALTPPDADHGAGRHARIHEAEADLQGALARAREALDGPGGRRGSTLGRHLDELTQAASQMAAQAETFGSALDALMERSDFAAVSPSFLPVLTALANTSRTAALAVVSRQPAHLATFELRIRRLKNLMSALASRARARTANSPEAQLLSDSVGRIGSHLDVIASVLRSTIERANERAAFSQELFEIDTWTLRPLAAALNFQLRPDMALIRYTVRATVLTMASVIALKALHLHHGYWLPFTIVVVLQPDYGSTRQRAAQRVVGTLVGSILASALLWLHPPGAILIAAIAATSFTFIYFIKRNYGIAVVFITLFVVLLTESSGPVDIGFTIERLVITTAGGLLALGAALFFWPTWERSRFPPILSAALRANRDYLKIVVDRVIAGRGGDDEVIRAQRAVESRNSAVFSSLRRMSGDPGNRDDEIQRAAALVNGNQRMTRVLNVLARQLKAGGAVSGGPLLTEFRDRACEALEALAEAAERGDPPREAFEALRAELDRMEAPAAAADATGEEGLRQSWITAQLGRASTELSAMLLA